MYAEAKITYYLETAPVSDFYWLIIAYTGPIAIKKK